MGRPPIQGTGHAARFDVARLALAAALFVAAGCSCPDVEPAPPFSPPARRSHNFAVYDPHGRLIHSPIGALRSELDAKGATHPISDVYVVIHGWNYTVEESVALFEGYRMLFEKRLPDLQAKDPSFEPYVVFVTWSSVSRPFSAGADSLSPLELPFPIDWTLDKLDTIAFHIPSNWGETEDAFAIALGDYDRRHCFAPSHYPRKGEPSVYERLAGAAAMNSIDDPFAGEPIPVSVLIDEMVRLKYPSRDDPARFRLHVIGHSFGGKIASLATLDACSRMLAAKPYPDAAPHVGRDKYVDSLVLVQPAMKVSEMYYPLRIDETTPPQTEDLLIPNRNTWKADDRMVKFDDALAKVDRKVLVHNDRDSANGWLFGLGQLLLNNDAIAESEVLDGSPLWLEPGAYVFDLGHALVGTVTRDVGVVLKALEDVVVELPTEPAQGLEDLVLFPISPIRYHQSMGNSGSKVVGSLPRFLKYVLPEPMHGTWVDKSVIGYFESATQHPPEDLLALSERAGTSAMSADWGVLNLYDAASLYTGFATGCGAVGGWVLNFIYPAKAHGDLHSYELLDGVRKRERTMNWIYNLTRVGRG